MQGAPQLSSPAEIAVQAGQQVPSSRLAERSLAFAEREQRLRQRAVGHPMGDFLGFAAELAHGQQTVLDGHPEGPLPDAEAIAAASRVGVPPLPATLRPRDPASCDGLRRIVRGLLPRHAGGPAAQQVERVRLADDAWREQQADRLRGGVMTGLDLAAAPLVGAALQVHWAHPVVGAQAARGANRLAPFGRVADPTVGPGCAGGPTARVLRIGADVTGDRDMHGPLCNVHWHVVPIECPHSQGTAGIGDESLRSRADTGCARPALQAVEVETCDQCRHSLKVVHMERDAHVEPIADDLATATLDLLVAESGVERHGVDLLLLFGGAANDDRER